MHSDQSRFYADDERCFIVKVPAGDTQPLNFKLADIQLESLDAPKCDLSIRTTVDKVWSKASEFSKKFLSGEFIRLGYIMSVLSDIVGPEDIVTWSISKSKEEFVFLSFDSGIVVATEKTTFGYCRKTTEHN